MSEIADKIFLGVDGGQSSTKAVVADSSGRILGAGFGGSLDHGNLPDGRRKLREALEASVSEALQKAMLPPLAQTIFEAAHCGMTGGADFKEAIVRQTINAKILTVGHDALIALCGATAGKPGVIAIAGTGSIVFGVDENGQTARAGGLGYLFSDEGSGFWLAVETIRLAIKEQDLVIPENRLQPLVLEYFSVAEIRELTNAFYNEQISRDRIAAFTERIFDAAKTNQTLKDLIFKGAKHLVENVRGVKKRLNFEKPFQVSPIGGLFHSSLMKNYFREILAVEIPQAIFAEPLLSPVVGAVLLACKNSGTAIDDKFLANLKSSYE